MSEKIIKGNYSVPNYKVEIKPDTEYTTDSKLKLKARDINLIKYNPNLFTNRGEFVEFLGGNRSLAIILGTSAVFYLYRRNVNPLRGIKSRHGIIYNNVYALMGLSFGLFYSALLSMPTQRVFNDYVAQYLLKRYPASKNITETNIWELKGRQI